CQVPRCFETGSRTLRLDLSCKCVLLGTVHECHHRTLDQGAVDFTSVLTTEPVRCEGVAAVSVKLYAFAYLFRHSFVNVLWRVRWDKVDLSAFFLCTSECCEVLKAVACAVHTNRQRGDEVERPSAVDESCPLQTEGEELPRLVRHLLPRDRIS